jgi:large subunit ribosomal protein L32
MAVPKSKISKSKRGSRRSANMKIKPINVVIDSTTGEYRLPHHVSLEDGCYNGKQVIVANEEKEAAAE